MVPNGSTCSTKVLASSIVINIVRNCHHAPTNWSGSNICHGVLCNSLALRLTLLHLALVMKSGRTWQPSLRPLVHSFCASVARNVVSNVRNDVVGAVT